MNQVCINYNYGLKKTAEILIKKLTINNNTQIKKHHIQVKNMTL